MEKNKFNSLLTPAVIVAALGYFVDVFDLLIFSIVRKTSLQDLGFGPEDQVSYGLLLHNLQMIGMLFGGIFWGIWADKKGRLSVLFGSILLYSIGNLLNGFVQGLPSYAICRIISGIGLAGELGAGITLVAESLPKEKRGYGTMLIASIGVSGAIFACILGEFMSWRMTYIVGGILGFALLLLRIKTSESEIFQTSHLTSHERGNFLSLFRTKERFGRFINSILVAVPIWYALGLLVQLAPEFSKALGVTGEVTSGRSIMFFYIGLVAGDLASGLLSQLIQSRTKVIFYCQIGLFLSIAAYFILGRNASPELFYAICLISGLFAGYWAVFVTMSAEQFGTNLRATVATSAPNFVRAAVVPMSLSFAFLKDYVGLLNSGMLVGFTVCLIALWANFQLKDTFHQDLNFLELD